MILVVFLPSLPSWWFRTFASCSASPVSGPPCTKCTQARCHWYASQPFPRQSVCMGCILPYSTLRPCFNMLFLCCFSRAEHTSPFFFNFLEYLVYLFNLTNMVFVGVYECMCMWCVCVDTRVSCVCICVCTHTSVCVAQRRVLGVLLCYSLMCFLGTGSLNKSRV